MPDQLEGIRVDRGRRRPIIKSELGTGFEEQRVLAAFGPQPESLLSAKDVNVFFKLPFLFVIRKQTFFDDGAVDPTETGPLGKIVRAGHDPALIRRRDGDCCATVLQQNDVRMLFHECQVVGESLACRRFHFRST